MAALQQRLAMREKGAFPISIGTSLALEGALGIHPDMSLKTQPLLDYKELWFNLDTIARNLIGSLSTQDKKAVTPDELVPAMFEDMAGTRYVVEQHAPRMKCVFYYNDYFRLAQKFPHAKLKQPSTHLQKEYAVVMADTVDKTLKFNNDFKIPSFKIQINGGKAKTLIVTHLPVDLLSRYRFNHLDLLESHTGKIKPYAEWNSKLSKSEVRHRLPFNRFTLQVFGDKQTQFSPQKKKVRDAVIQIANENNWTPVTTDDKIRRNIKKLEDKEIVEQLLTFI